MMPSTELEEEQLQAEDLQPLIDIIGKKYGLDFNEYTKSSLVRRVNNAARELNIRHKFNLLPLLDQDSKLFDRFVNRLFVTVSSMFRDPEFYTFLRQVVLPRLKNEPYIKIWHAGCSTGEEVYSMAILLGEEGLYEKTTIYATDINSEALLTAKRGVYSTKDMRFYTQNYYLAGGTQPFSNYYSAKYGLAKMDESLKKNIVFAKHDLANDIAFGDMHLILCRNVLIYFEKELQERVFDLMRNCLYRNGFLCLGSKERLDFSENFKAFKVISANNRVYQLAR